MRWKGGEDKEEKVLRDKIKYEGRLQSSWTHLITPSRSFVEVR
jgi:hypothetical protein